MLVLPLTAEARLSSKRDLFQGKYYYVSLQNLVKIHLLHTKYGAPGNPSIVFSKKLLCYFSLIPTNLFLKYKVVHNLELKNLCQEIGILLCAFVVGWVNVRTRKNVRGRSSCTSWENMTNSKIKVVSAR
jgi:hypothetical protein